ncbi:hypothetical protein INP83_09770 [Mucilaginibacter sp. 21P]|uniref:hypothetical protein n=1 Tax=Mucilaginibacter sp. 21P TaxID=2778902 RepID=UPI001C593712|nr:hypothetical protein [Mucilaginibacter sp. 21P]QXV67352.1 hypothetical protein INP83_09770 [Mucilaginibacter sp. 21P]
MTTTEIKEELHKAIDNVPETSLNEALAFLKSLQSNSEKKLKRARNFERILEEDKDVLERLAK